MGGEYGGTSPTFWFANKGQKCLCHPDRAPQVDIRMPLVVLDREELHVSKRRDPCVVHDSPED